jgi:hypothetical protein
MPTLISHRVKCRKLLCQAAKRREKITFKQLSASLGLKLARQEWSTVLGPIAVDEVNKTGHDLTLVVVYTSGRRKGLGHYFSDIRSGAPPQSDILDPRDPQQVADYEQALEQVFNRYANVQC